MLINLRNALMTGKRLPYDAEVEYLQSTGTGSTLAWVDTGIPNTANIRVEATARCVATSQRNTIDLYVFGSGWGAGRDDAYGIVYSDFWTNLGKCMLLTRGGKGGSFSPDMGTSITGDGQFHYFVYETNDSMSSIIVDNGTPFVITTPRNVNGQTYGVFGPRDNETSSGIAQIAQLKIYDANGVLVRDYIPVRVGTVGYLYDRVSGKLFGNAGTGDFVVGPDVVPVEYIESHGTEWIDTGVIPYGRTPIARVDFALQNLVNKAGVFGTWASNNRRLQIFVGNNYTGSLGLGTYEDYTFRRYTRYDITLNGDTKTALVNGSTISGFNTDNGFGNYNLYLCWRNNNNGDGTPPAIMRCYACQIWDGSTPLRSFRPIRVGTDATSWDGAMMDVLTRRIYRNAGTGAFTYGNDLKYPIPAE